MSRSATHLLNLQPTLQLSLSKGVVSDSSAELKDNGRRGLLHRTEGRGGVWRRLLGFAAKAPMFQRLARKVLES